MTGAEFRTTQQLGTEEISKAVDDALALHYQFSSRGPSHESCTVKQSEDACHREKRNAQRKQETNEKAVDFLQYANTEPLDPETLKNPS